MIVWLSNCLIVFGMYYIIYDMFPEHHWWYRCGWCLVHQRTCTIDEPADLHIAGTPCTAHSQIGLQEEEQSKAFGYFILWLGMRKKIAEPVIIQENVKSFPRSHFTTYLPEYEWVFTTLNPMEVGWPVQRERQWIVSLS